MHIRKVFNKEKNILIGALHLPPSLGYKDFPGIDLTTKNALKDLSALERGGADAIIFENNYDYPHHEFVAPGTIAVMTYVGRELRKHTKLPLGISVLWNDYKTALAIAKTVNLQFIRIPVFVDTVKTAFGTIRGEARKVVIERKALDAEHVALLTDIHVKHSELISKMSLEESACTAIQAGSDGIIITGRWTGQSPDLSEVQKLRRKIGLFPLLVGSGLSSENASELLQYANGAIVSTSLKSGSIKAGEHNVKSYSQRISTTRVHKLRERM